MTLVLDDSTTIHLLPPTEELCRHLAAYGEALQRLIGEPVDDETPEETSRAVYDFTALLLSINREQKRFTAADLINNYAMSPDLVVAFYVAYADFIRGINERKN